MNTNANTPSKKDINNKWVKNMLGDKQYDEANDNTKLINAYYNTANKELSANKKILKNSNSVKRSERSKITESSNNTDNDLDKVDDPCSEVQSDPASDTKGCVDCAYIIRDEMPSIVPSPITDMVCLVSNIITETIKKTINGKMAEIMNTILGNRLDENGGLQEEHTPVRSAFIFGYRKGLEKIQNPQVSEGNDIISADRNNGNGNGNGSGGGSRKKRKRTNHRRSMKGGIITEETAEDKSKKQESNKPSIYGTQDELEDLLKSYKDTSLFGIFYGEILDSLTKQIKEAIEDVVTCDQLEEFTDNAIDNLDSEENIDLINKIIERDIKIPELTNQVTMNANINDGNQGDDFDKTMLRLIDSFIKSGDMILAE